MILSNYEPRAVFAHFEAINQIPRGSGNEKAVSDYIKNFAENLGCKAVQDQWHNLVLYKPATSGYENQPPIVLQAHLDMVCEKNADTVHDFATDPIDMYVDGDYIKARGTTLGADNGLAVAMCMALLEATDIQHPPLEIVLTSEEETGMAGARNLDPALVTGRRMINLDSTKDWEFIMGCAAGTTVEYLLPVEYENTPAGYIGYKITVDGLTGGHSGDDINKERGNANRIIGHILAAIVQENANVCISDISGGMKINAIPREAVATIMFEKKDAGRIDQVLDVCRANFATQYRATESTLKITHEPASADRVMTATSVDKLVSSLLLMPSGVLCESKELAGLVNASCNLGVIETVCLEGDVSRGHVKFSVMPRGAARFYNEQTERQISQLATLTGATVTFMQRSPAWPYNPDSTLLKTALRCYTPVFGQDAKVTAIHAGLECGLFSEKLPGLDIIAFGATNIDLHTPDERLSISSTAKVWEFVVELLGVL